MDNKNDEKRKLHPKLRMLGNGSAIVNGLRSDISTMVASPPGDIATVAFDIGATSLAAVQESLHSLNVEDSLPTTGRLPKREKLEAGEPATESFVNVFVELRPQEGLYQSGGSDSLKALEAALPDLAGHHHLDAQDGMPCTCVRRGHQICVTLPVSKLAELEASESVAFVAPSEPLKLDVPIPASSGVPTTRRVAAKRGEHRDGEGIIIGIVDVGGFDFAHEDFLDENGETRFLAIWDQGGTFRQPPAQFGYGSEFTRENLNLAIREARDGVFPANDLERQSQRSPSSHGTHVSSIAAGNRGVCPKADIAAVLIDVPVAEDLLERRRSTFSDTSRIVHAVEYLLRVAEEKVSRFRSTSAWVPMAVPTMDRAESRDGSITL
ncbi:MAG: S8 family serine peptidase [Verrucomicrobiales bacterium]